MVQFKRYSLYELFDEKVGRGTRLTRAHRVLGDYPLATAGEQNTGVSDWIVENKQLFTANSITIDMFGNVFYRSYDFYADDNILVLHRDDWSKEVMLYVTAQIHHVLKDRFDYSRQFRQKVLKTVDIELPVTQSGTPDFSYMTKKIRELEAERIRELEAYLKVAGLDDTTLSGSEAAALTQKVVWKKFRIGDVFDIHPSVRKINANAVKFNGHYPYVARGTSTNGIRGYIDWDTTDLNPANTISFGQDTATIYYQDKPYFTGDKIQIFELKDNFPELNPAIAQFLITCLNAVFGSYSWGQQSFAVKKLRNADFMLPINPNNQIDFIYMQNYIRAIEKQTIKNVVAYKDQVINDTKKVVNE